MSTSTTTSNNNSNNKILASIVIPTYKEGANLKELITRIFKAIETEQGNNKSNNSFLLTTSNTEVIVVDDNSQDGSEQIVNELSQQPHHLNARIIVRTQERGLSSAVLRGFSESRGDFLMCMDADLQHPPEAVPAMFRELISPTSEKNKKEKKVEEAPVEFVLGTRYGSGEMSVDKNWPAYRRFISKTARLMARALTPLSDPMSGFFVIRRDTYERAKRTGINPIGFKIALELYVKAGVKRHREVPFAFGVRLYGYSKLSSKVIVHYLSHLRELYMFTYGTHLYVVLALIAILVLFGTYRLLLH